MVHQILLVGCAFAIVAVVSWVRLVALVRLIVVSVVIICVNVEVLIGLRAGSDAACGLDRVVNSPVASIESSRSVSDRSLELDLDVLDVLEEVRFAGVHLDEQFDDLWSLGVQLCLPH